MKKGLTELVFILDRRGSMAGLEGDTIGGFNGMIRKQQQEEGEANVTTVLFDDQIELVHDRFPLSIVKPLTEDYYVRGTTALLDAVGSTVKKIENIQNRLPDDMKAEKVLFVITTDGMENASREYTAKMVKNMIEKHQEHGWKFLFLGANMDAAEEVEKIGIRRTHAASYRNDSKGVEINFHAAGKIMSCLRKASAMTDEMDDEMVEEEIEACLQPVREHLEGRKSKLR